MFSYLNFQLTRVWYLKGHFQIIIHSNFLAIQNARKLQLIIMVIYFYRELSFRNVSE